MRKFILAAMVAALAVPATLPAFASAQVARYQLEKLEFTATSPYGAPDQWDNLWHYKFTEDLNPCTNTFKGTDVITGTNGEVVNETNSGTLNSDGTISIQAQRAPFYYINSWSVDGAPTNGTAFDLKADVPWEVQMKLGPLTVTPTTNYKNHGDFVSSQPDRDDAAHSCIGMPINSSN